MSTGTDDPISCIMVLVSQVGDNFEGTWTSPTSGTFADTVTCDVVVQSIPGGTFIPSPSSDFFSFSNLQFDLSECGTGLLLARPRHQTFWAAFSFDPDPTTWTSEQTIEIIMTLQ